MKKTILTLSILAICLTTMAQSSSFGIQIGFMQPILRENAPTVGTSLNQKTTLNGGKIGFVYDATLIKGFGMSIALNYAFSGNHTDWITDSAYGMKYPRHKDKNFMHTIEIPIDWQYKFEVAKHTYIILYTGPSIKYNFSFRRNKTTQQTATSEIINSGWNNLYNLDDDQDLKKDYMPINITWNVGAGFQYKNYYLRGGYDFGIYYPYRDPYFNLSDGTTYRRRGRFDEWSIRLGIYFLNF